MVEKSSVSLKLSKCVLGGHDIRYLSLSNNGYVYSTSFSKMTQIKDTPLFLATDILSGIEQDKKNFYRIHSRFAKDGLATKLTFTDTVLVGINNSNGIWFYSIQGLFQAVFEYHHLKTQRQCVLELLNLWLARYGDEKLVSAIRVKIKNQHESPIHRTLSAIQSDVTITGNDMQSSSNDCVSNTNTVTDLQATNDNLSNIYAKSDLQSLTYDSSEHAALEKNNKRSLSHTASSIHDKHDQLLACYKTNMICISDYTSLQDLLCSFVNSLKAEYDKCPTQFCKPSQIEALCSVLELLKEELDEPSQGFPFDLISQYQSEVKRNLCSFNQKDEFGISWKRSLALCIISDWLGKEFNQLEPEIALKVEKFKTDHIESIDNLPKAESMVDMLFPSCMKCLLCSWVGIGQPSINVDHDYGNLSKRRKQSYQTSRNLFPLIQIILEFMNNALISGVAHVVFTRLLQTT